MRRANDILRRIRRVNAGKFTPSGTCFYCGCEIFKRPETGCDLLPDGHTREHIFPINLIAAVSDGSQRWSELNSVSACYRENTYKANLHPLDWLVIMSSDAGAERLAVRLGELGVPEASVARAMLRRPAAEEA